MSRPLEAFGHSVCPGWLIAAGSLGYAAGEPLPLEGEQLPAKKGVLIQTMFPNLLVGNLHLVSRSQLGFLNLRKQSSRTCFGSQCGIRVALAAC